MQDLKSALRAYMDMSRLSEQDLARAAGVSQSTVSRALNATAVRRGKARARLFKYCGINEYLEHTPDRVREVVMGAFERVWDRSDDHAAAIAKVIDALADLRSPFGAPRKKE